MHQHFLDVMSSSWKCSLIITSQYIYYVLGNVALQRIINKTDVFETEYYCYFSLHAKRMPHVVVPTSLLKLNNQCNVYLQQIHTFSVFLREPTLLFLNESGPLNCFKIVTLYSNGLNPVKLGMLAIGRDGLSVCRSVISRPRRI